MTRHTPIIVVCPTPLYTGNGLAFSVGDLEIGWHLLLDGSSSEAKRQSREFAKEGMWCPHTNHVWKKGGIPKEPFPQQN